MNEKLLYQLALTYISGVGDITARNLLEIVGDEEAIFKSSLKSLTTIKGISSKLANEILNPQVLRDAEKELLFIEKNNIQTFFITDSNYPNRLKECVDAPIFLRFKGNADLNSSKIISIVGTRKPTQYGENFCNNFIEELANYTPDIIIVSGLAYGIDIYSHRACVKNNLSTIGVLAHGLDRIYPPSHRKTAISMLEKGGLLTEFSINTMPDKFNFVRRNRIIAGLADATIVVESANKGGSLITAEIANTYNREVFAVPGKITDDQSKGCNKLISQNKANILLSAESFLESMNWDNVTIKRKPIQKKLFLELSEDEQKVFDLLNTSEDMHVNSLAIETETPISQLFLLLFEMEMKGIVKPLPGGTYCLTK